MPLKNLDFSGVKERVALEEGLYTLAIVGAEVKPNSKGKDMLVVTYQEEGSGNKMFDNITIQENTMWKLKELLDAVGIPTEGGIDDLDEADLIGQVVQAKVVQEPYTDEVTGQQIIQNRIKRVYPA